MNRAHLRGMIPNPLSSHNLILFHFNPSSPSATDREGQVSLRASHRPAWRPACADSVPAPTAYPYRLSLAVDGAQKSTPAVVSMVRAVVFFWSALASGARGRTEAAGGSADLGRFCARQAWRISGSSEEKRGTAAGSEAGVSGESEAVWSPAQRVSTRRPSLGPPLASASASSPLCDAVWNSDTGAEGLRWLRSGDCGRRRGEGRTERGDFANIYAGEVITRSRKNLIYQTTQG